MIIPEMVETIPEGNVLWETLTTDSAEERRKKYRNAVEDERGRHAGDDYIHARDDYTCQICGAPSDEIHHLFDEGVPFCWTLIAWMRTEWDPLTGRCIGGWDELPTNSRLRDLEEIIHGDRDEIANLLEDIFWNDGRHDEWNRIAVCQDCHVGKMGYHTELMRRGSLREIEEYLAKKETPVVVVDNLANVARPRSKLNWLATERPTIASADPGSLHKIQVQCPYQMNIYGLAGRGTVPTYEDEFADLIEVDDEGTVTVDGVTIREGSTTQAIKWANEQPLDPVETDDPTMA